MRILIAPDKFKGSLSAREVCLAIEKGLRKKNKSLQATLHPMADGGDGSLDVLYEYLDLKRQVIQTVDPLGKTIKAPYFISNDTAFIEVASASGLVLLKKNNRNPLYTSTLGTGKMITDAISKGFSNIYLFLGGSATNDAGMGIASTLGCRFLDKDNEELLPIGDNLSKVSNIKFNPFFDIKKVSITLLCDVTNPLFGINGAAHVYAAQKGAIKEEIVHLDNGLKNISRIIHQQFDLEISQISGIGAAGGIGACLTSMFGAKIKKGFEEISIITNLEKQIQLSDLVISGEGKLDSQSLEGKVVDGVARLCKKHKKPLILLVGKNQLGNQGKSTLQAKQILSISKKAKNTADAMSNGAKYLVELASKIEL